MPKFTVQMGEEDYRIVGPDGDEGIMVPYGTVATLCEEPDTAGNPPALYFCLITDPDDSRVDRLALSGNLICLCLESPRCNRQDQ